MSTRNICFCGEIRKLFSLYPLLSRALLLILTALITTATEGIFRFCLFFLEKMWLNISYELSAKLDKTWHFILIICQADNCLADDSLEMQSYFL